MKYINYYIQQNLPPIDSIFIFATTALKYDTLISKIPGYDGVNVCPANYIKFIFVVGIDVTTTFYELGKFVTATFYVDGKLEIGNVDVDIGFPLIYIIFTFYVPPPPPPPYATLVSITPGYVYVTLFPPT